MTGTGGLYETRLVSQPVPFLTALSTDVSYMVTTYVNLLF